LIRAGGSVDRARQIIDSLSPGGGRYKLTVPLQPDESMWFVRAVDDGLIVFQPCDGSCRRKIRYGVAGPDEFVVAPGQFRHLFSAPMTTRQRLNREYVPHIGACGLAITKYGYDSAHASFSRYRAFRQDRISKTAGAGYETDAEFYSGDTSIYLHIEVKTKPAEVEAIAKQLDEAGSLLQLPAGTRKEIEYVLELAPAYFWLVGPGTVDPPRHVFSVKTDGRTASFSRVAGLPAAPTWDGDR
jgi:hypothetical protein